MNAPVNINNLQRTDYSAEPTKVKPSEAIAAIILAIKARKVPLLRGSPGIGKSDIMHAIAEMFDLKVIDERLTQCDITDLKGFPTFVNGRAKFVPMDTFPIEGDELPIKYDKDGNPRKDPVTGEYLRYAGWLLFLDELTSAERDIQAAAYKLILDRKVGQDNLHRNVAIVAAGNMEDDGAIVEHMSTALESRLVHLELVLDVIEWLGYAHKKHVDPRITSYISMMPQNLYTFKPDHNDHTYGCPRTWFFVNDFLKQGDLQVPGMKANIAGSISNGLAHDFYQFCSLANQMPTILDIQKGPKHVFVPTEPSILFLLTGSIAHHAKTDNIDALMEYVERMPVEFQTVCVKHTLARNKALLTTKGISKWLATTAIELY